MKRGVKMLEIVYGHTNEPSVIAQLSNSLKRTFEEENFEGTLYIGYPIINTADDRIEVDALLISKEHGLIAFLIEGEENESAVSDRQNRLYFGLTTSLGKHESLRAGRKLALDPTVLSVFPETPKLVVDGCISIDKLSEYIRKNKQDVRGHYRSLQAALQRVTNIKPVKKRARVNSERSKGAVLKKIEKEIANLDQWQKRAAIESPDGPQRIRGLAGSGKTIVLALKAAYLHSQYPDWKIVVTFQSRSLYQQFFDLIRRFSFEHLNDEPNWENLKVQHAWGGYSEGPGIYTEISNHVNHVPLNFSAAASKYGREEAFRGACTELLNIVNSSDITPIFDAVLIDEAQDFPAPFFQLVHKLTKSPKRIIWAYDELQKLSESSMPPVTEIFGRKVDGSPVVRLNNEQGKPCQDILLPVCYRNTPWALTMGHALGFGIYRKPNDLSRAQLVQHFEPPQLWNDIGYKVVSGCLEDGKEVSLKRGESSYPKFFDQLLSPTEALQIKVFDSDLEQAEWVAENVWKNLFEDELDHDDILIIIPNAYRSKLISMPVAEALLRRGIRSHLAGVNSSKDDLFTDKSIAMANIYRSKGNEAPMVYIIDSQYCYAGYELITLRNTLFTAITRSRGWVNILGRGPDMAALAKEMECVIETGFHLNFKIPDKRERAQLRQIHRDRSDDEKLKIQKIEDSLKDFIELVRRGELSLESFPPDIRMGILRILDNSNEQKLD